MKNKHTILGWLIILAGIAILIVSSIALAEIENQALRILSPMSCGVFGGCAVLGGIFIRRGRGGKAAKEFEVAQRDERNIAINGKAAFIGFLLVIFLVVNYAAYVSHVLMNMAAGFMGYGIAAAGFLTYFIAYQVYSKKM